MAHPPVGMILAAGFGQRLQPLSLLRPKPIMEIAAKPIVYFLLRILEKAGIKDVVLNLHHHSQQIRTALTRYQFNCRIHLVYEKDILDTAGGVANAIRKLGINNRKMVIIHGDIIGDIDLRPLVERDNFISLVCAEDRYIEGYRGNVAVDSRGHIVELGRFFVSQRSVRKRGFFTGLQILSEQAVSLIKDCSKESLV
ncbi:MAG TPA: sugar phosphate nucleotidyltransferase, partial [Myxococcota bacterium]|nr:sugar phosphate nucleotidyltransferase [Myxococcota bacterium]